MREIYPRLHGKVAAQTIADAVGEYARRDPVLRVRTAVHRINERLPRIISGE